MAETRTDMSPLLKRRLYRGRDVRCAQNVAELRAMVAARLPNFCLEYLEGGADDELMLHRNRASYDAIAFALRTLVDVSVRDPGCTLFGERIAMTGGKARGPGMRWRFCVARSTARWACWAALRWWTWARTGSACRA